MSKHLGRRTFMKATVVAAWSNHSLLLSSQTTVPNSSGIDRPTLKAPASACDCHIHIYDAARFPMAPSQRVPPAQAAVAQYRLLQRRLGTTRVVVVTPRNYGTDNKVTLDAVSQLGDSARAVAVVHPTVTDDQLARMHKAGVRGIRFSLNDPATAVVTFDMVEPLSARAAALGWHVQFNIDGSQIVDKAAMLRRLPSAIVFDHMGHPPLPAGTAHPSHRIVRDLIDQGRTWVKLSGAYFHTRSGPPYAEATAIARAFATAAPERVVWGSDWPHPTEPPERKPNDALLFDLLLKWAPADTTRHKILVTNPAELYGFVNAD
jgi:predicted TIM-barrel fold metal-dependent hydrolase